MRPTRRASKLYAVLINGVDGSGLLLAHSLDEGGLLFRPVTSQVPLIRLHPHVSPEHTTMCYVRMYAYQDGYQRTWSIEGKVLGQFALPNASDVQLKRRHVSPGTHARNALEEYLLTKALTSRWQAPTLVSLNQLFLQSIQRPCVIF